MELEPQSDAKEIDEFLDLAINVLDVLGHKLVNDPVFKKAVFETNIFRKTKEIERKAASINSDPDAANRASAFKTQQVG